MLFVTSIEIDNVVKGKGFGISKKESQQNAAREAIKNIDISSDVIEKKTI